MREKFNLTGKKYNRLLVKKFMGNRVGNGGYYWECVCDCGNICVVRATLIVRGLTKSCGCLVKEVNSKRMTTYGKGRSSLSAVWRAIKNRCYNKNNHNYSSYGGRGINMCPRWKNNFLKFEEDIGCIPKGMQIDRINNSKGYLCGKCVWCRANGMKTPNWRLVTSQVNNRNKRDSIYLTYKGETRHLLEWAKILNMNPKTIYQRLSNGWSHHDALSRKPKTY